MTAQRRGGCVQGWHRGNASTLQHFSDNILIPLLLFHALSSSFSITDHAGPSRSLLAGMSPQKGVLVVGQRPYGAGTGGTSRVCLGWVQQRPRAPRRLGAAALPRSGPTGPCSPGCGAAPAGAEQGAGAALPSGPHTSTKSWPAARRKHSGETQCLCKAGKAGHGVGFHSIGGGRVRRAHGESRCSPCPHSCTESALK